MTRKSPIRHKVKSHTRKGKKVISFMRGSGKQKLQTKKRLIKKNKRPPIYTTIEGRRNTIKNLREEAQDYEQEGEWNEAMALYKEADTQEALLEEELRKRKKK